MKRLVPVADGPNIFPSTSSGSGASSKVVDCFKVEPLAFLVEASNEEEESLETRERKTLLGCFQNGEKLNTDRGHWKFGGEAGKGRWDGCLAGTRSSLAIDQLADPPTFWKFS